MNFRTVTRFAIVVFLLENLCVAQDREAHWRADLDFLATELPKLHFNAFHSLSNDEFNAKINELKDSVADRDDSDLALQISKLVASIGDGHTTVMLDRRTLTILPLKFGWFKDGIFIIEAAQKYRQAFGGKVTRVGSVPIEDVLTEISKYLAHDNEHQLKSQSPYSMGIAEFLVAIGAWDDLKSGSIEYEKAGEVITLDLKAGPAAIMNALEWVTRAGESPLYAQKSQLDHWNDWLADSRTLYFKYNRCKNAKAFNKLTNGTAGFIKQNDVQRFVLDLRDNGGGSSIIFYPLLRYITDHETLNDKDKLFVIIGRRTFSSAVHNAMHMRKTKATFVGEPTGGKPNHFGEVKSMTLPHSKLKVQYSTKYFTLIKNSDPPAITPDIEIEPTFDDWYRGRDPVLEAILKR